jgi:uncharacterized SAM-binding protein YcdF (DUF218 family)
LADAVAASVRRRGVWWWTWRVLLGLAVVAIGYYLVTLVQVVRAGNSDDARPADAIVVLGAAQYDGRPSPQLAGRLDHVVELWEQGLAPLVVVTGGNQPGDRFTEAEASRRYLVERGVPESAIIGEGAGASTYESLDAVADLLEARGAGEVVLVTDPYHALRTRLTAEEVGLTARVSPTPDGPDSWSRRLGEAAGVAVGRIIGFERLADLVA